MKAIREFEGLRALRLEGNTVGVEAAHAIAKALEDKCDFQVRTLSHTVLHSLIVSHTVLQSRSFSQHPAMAPSFLHCLIMPYTVSQVPRLSHNVIHYLTMSHTVP